MRARPQIPLLAGLMALTGCASTLAAQDEAASEGAEYVAMGSSFAAGAAIGPTKPGTPQRCGRTVNNYPTLLASRLGMELDDQTCGGATTAHVLAPWGELPAQIDAVGPSTRLVTVTIGGNDVNYVGALFMASCTPGEIVEAGEYKIPCVEPSPPTEEAYRSLETGLLAIARQVKQRAPQARLVFVQYVSLVPDQPCEQVRMSDANLAMTRAIGERVTEVTKSVASQSHAMLLEMDKLSEEHTPCDADPWSNGMTDQIDLSQGAPWHPNSRGHKVIAETMAARLGAE